jgi:polyphosphate kinase 2 (PPK2 family)
MLQADPSRNVTVPAHRTGTRGHEYEDKFARISCARRREGQTQALAHTRAACLRVEKDHAKLLEEQIEQLNSLQRLLHASNRYAVLLTFQAMDAAGKGGAIAHVMSGFNPPACQAFSLKHPTATELDDDFSWRSTRELPERGRIGFFNRSYCEEVLIGCVHPAA